MRTIAEVAREIKHEWKKVNYAAQPYLTAMYSLDYPNDNYGLDDSKEIVTRFLVNASTFKGIKARELKKELRDIIKQK